MSSCSHKLLIQYNAEKTNAVQLQNKVSGLEMAMSHEQTDTKKEQIFCRKVSEEIGRQKRSGDRVAEQIYRCTEGEDTGKLKSC